MGRMEIFCIVLEGLQKYNLDDLNEYDEAVKCTEFLMKRSDVLTIAEIDKFLFNRYEDYLY